MGVHVPNFEVEFEWSSPVRAAFQLHMKVPLVENGSADQGAAVADAERLIRCLNAEDWAGAAELLEGKVKTELGKEIIRVVFATRAKYSGEAETAG